MSYETLLFEIRDGLAFITDYDAGLYILQWEPR